MTFVWPCLVLCQMYISDYNLHSTELDFRKALDLLSFVDKVRVFLAYCWYYCMTVRH